MRGNMGKLAKSICMATTVCLLLAVAGCGHGEGPAEVVSEYIEAVNHHDLAAVYELLVNEDRENYPEELILQGFHLAEHQEEAKNQLGAIQLFGDTASVEIITIYHEGISVQKIILRKEEGRWKISLSRTIAEALKQKEAQAHSEGHEESHEKQDEHESEPGHEESLEEGHEQSPQHGH